jgi:nucleoside phosphorylase
MNLKEVTILVWDNLENFHSKETQRQFGNGNLYKSVEPFNSLEVFERKLLAVDDSELIVICCHINYQDFGGYWDYGHSGILSKYAGINTVYLSSGDSGEVMQELYKKSKDSVSVILYNELVKKLKHDDIIPQLKAQLTKPEMHSGPESNVIRSTLGNYPKVNIAIITALYQNEFEEICKFIDFPETEIIRTATKEYHIGYLRTNRKIRVVAGIPSATGMVDSAIIATQMLEFFRPEYLLMSGVCGGKDGLAFGDVVVGKQFFTFQKGKLSDLHTKKNPRGIPNKINLYDRRGKIIDYTSLFDDKGNLVRIGIERFEIEHDAIIEMRPLLKDQIERHRLSLESAINEQLKPVDRIITVHFEPIACSTMVINKDGFFEDQIKSIHRKTLAIEMESYAVARACQFANDGKTTPLIFKSVMDHTKNKDESAKRFAAFTSALFLNALLEKNILISKS